MPLFTRGGATAKEVTAAGETAAAHMQVQAVTAAPETHMAAAAYIIVKVHTAAQVHIAVWGICMEMGEMAITAAIREVPNLLKRKRKKVEAIGRRLWQP